MTRDLRAMTVAASLEVADRPHSRLRTRFDRDTPLAGQPRSMHQETGWHWDKAQIARKRVRYHRRLFENIDRLVMRPDLNQNRCLRLHNIREPK